MIEIRSSRKPELSELQFQRLFEIVTHAYAETERSMFGDGYVRVSEEDFRKHFNDNQVFVALSDYFYFFLVM